MFWGGVDVRPIKKTSDGTKLFLDKLNPNGRGILVYSLCGEPPTNIYDVAEIKQYVKIYPNPTNDKVKIEVILPNNSDEFRISVYDNNANVVRDERISLNQTQIEIDMNTLASGGYFFSLNSKGTVYQTGKFVLTR